MKWFDAIKIFIICYCCLENKDEFELKKFIPVLPFVEMAFPGSELF